MKALVLPTILIFFALSCSTSKPLNKSIAASVSETKARSKTNISDSLEKIILSQRSFNVGERYYETTCRVNGSKAKGNILPLTQSDSAEFNGVFTFRYYDESERPAGQKEVEARVKDGVLNTEVMDGKAPSLAARCSLSLDRVKL